MSRLKIDFDKVNNDATSKHNAEFFEKAYDRLLEIAKEIDRLTELSQQYDEELTIEKTLHLREWNISPKPFWTLCFYGGFYVSAEDHKIAKSLNMKLNTYMTKMITEFGAIRASNSDNLKFDSKQNAERALEWIMSRYVMLSLKEVK